VSLNIIDPFYRELYARISAQLGQRADQLVEGQAKGNSVGETAEKYAAQVSYIKALRDVIEMCGDIEKARYPDQSRDEE